MTKLELSEMWHGDLSTQEICKHFGISRSHLHAESVRHGLGRRTHVPRIGVVSSKAIIDPTPEEIKERCEQVRSQWTESETRRRSGAKQCRPVQKYYYDGRDCSFSY